jgi:hypothetical protein
VSTSTDPYFYLSFVNTDLPYLPENDYPGGPRWTGACFVPGENIMEAVSHAWILGCNPGGEVQGFGPVLRDAIPEHYRHRLLSRDDLDQMGREFGYSGEDLDPIQPGQPGLQP